ncbi:MAG: hypothetical protein JWO38_1734 [Gemmataceae bacterium]|nr:hypothetical protein [Gemmataceae bacterium]
MTRPRQPYAEFVAPSPTSPPTGGRIGPASLSATPPAGRVGRTSRRDLIARLWNSGVQAEDAFKNGIGRTGANRRPDKYLVGVRPRPRQGQPPRARAGPSPR